jgi:hypothetical protein
MSYQQTINPKVSPLSYLLAVALVVALGCFAHASAQWTAPDGNGNISNTNSGNVGVGTNAPAHKLEVSGNIYGTNIFSSKRVFRDAFANSGDAAIWYKIATLPVTTSGTGDLLDLRINGGRFDAVNKFGMEVKMGNRLGFNAYVYSATGQVSERLYSRVMAYNNGGAVDVYLYLPNGYGLPSYSSIGVDMTATGWGAGPTLYPTSAGTTTTPAGTLVFDSSTAAVTLTINNSGNVGLGNTSPAYKLDVSGAVNSTGGLCIAGDCKTAWSQVGGSQWTTSGTSVFYNTGNVGIGTSTPTQKLEVNGSAVIPTLYGSSAASGVLTLQSTSHATKGTIQIGVDQTTTTSIGQSGTTGNKLIVATDRLIVNNSSVRVNGATDYGDLSVTKVNITNPDALQFRTTNPNITSNGSILFTVQNAGGDNVKFNVQNSSVSNAFVIDTNSATPAKLLDIRNLGTSKFTVSGNGDVTVAGNIAAKYQDMAEWVESSQELTPGMVVVLDASKSNHVVAATQSYDSRVAGVISLQPGITLGERGEGRVLVATTGRVKVKVDASNGPIAIGDLLVTSDRGGFAMKSVPIEIGGARIHRPGTLIGKALEPWASGTGEILVLLSLQ